MESRKDSLQWIGEYDLKRYYQYLSLHTATVIHDESPVTSATLVMEVILLMKSTAARWIKIFINLLSMDNHDGRLEYYGKTCPCSNERSP